MLYKTLLSQLVASLQSPKIFWTSTYLQYDFFPALIEQTLLPFHFLSCKTQPYKYLSHPVNTGQEHNIQRPDIKHPKVISYVIKPSTYATIQNWFQLKTR